MNLRLFIDVWRIMTKSLVQKNAYEHLHHLQPSWRRGLRQQRPGPQVLQERRRRVKQQPQSPQEGIRLQETFQLKSQEKYTKRQNELYNEVRKLFPQSSTDVPALLPCAMLPRQARGTRKNNSLQNLLYRNS